MRFVATSSFKNHEVKKSKFISYIVPYKSYDETLQTLKEEHPKARHFVVAYRFLNEYNQVVEYSSDDGEPKGTSGKPTLMVLQGAEIINTALITVRYFGGTKLGTGGLVRAYSDAANLVLSSAELFEYKEEEELFIEFEYSNIRIVEYECEQNHIHILEKFFLNTTKYKVRADKKNLELFLSKVDRIILKE